jgi:glutathione synthase/RimK-type ligase-like ATP-grasp enzyme
MSEVNEWKIAAKKFQTEIHYVDPFVLYNYTSSLPKGVYNMIGPVNTTHKRFLKELEIQGVNPINRIQDSCVADDKFMSALECRKHNLPVPKNLDLNLLAGIKGNLKGEIGKRIGRTIGYPCVIKVPENGYGQGHFLVKDENQFDDLYSMLALTNCRFGVFESGVDFFVQEFITNGDAYADNVRVYVWKGQVVSAHRRYSTTYWKNNLALYNNDSGVEFDYPIDDDMRYICTKACEIFKLKFAGLDLYITPKGWVLGEINTSPTIYVPDRNIFGNMNIFEELISEMLTPTFSYE